MKVTLTNITENYLQSYTLTKVIDNNFLKETINSELLVTNSDDHSYLFESCINGDDKETGTIEKECGTETFTKDIYIKHNEGTFNLKECITEKKIAFANELDCLSNLDINIFDYKGSVTNTIQGDLQKEIYGTQLFHFIGDYSVNFTLNDALALVEGYPDKSALGLFPEYISISAQPIQEQQSDPSLGTYYQYVHHDIQIVVNYIGAYSATQYNSDWHPHPTSGYFYSKFPVIQWKAPQITQTTIYDIYTIEYFNDYVWEAGNLGTYKDVEISNTFSINEILEDLFSCTGLTLVSNFLGINPDATNPDNNKYTFALDNCQDLKIVQSYDIIRESALEDSFGQSGLIKSKDFLADICLVFNLLIVKDDTNIRIEHITYYTRKGIDIRLKEYEFSELKMNRDEIDSEVFSFAQPTPTDGFYQTKITYDNIDLYKEPNEKQYKSKLFLTDVFGCLNNKDYETDAYKKLFYLLSTDGENIVGLNNALSIKNLVLSLHDIQRPMKTGKIDNEVITFEGFSIGLSGEIKLESNLLSWDLIKPLMSVLTQYGAYLIEEVSIDDSDEMTLKIKK